MNLSATLLSFSLLVQVAFAGHNYQLYFDDEVPCLAAYGGGSFTRVLETNRIGCTAGRVEKNLKAAFANVQALCAWDFTYEMRLLTRTLSESKEDRVLDILCEKAHKEVFTTGVLPNKSWTDISPGFTNAFMEDYTDGETFLNLNQGNVRHKRNIALDPQSAPVGVDIQRFFDDFSTRSILQPTAVQHLDNCENQAIMCCWGRDRQFGDNNGDCAKNDCNNKAPGDNSNLCYDNSSGSYIKHNGDEQIHCHGFAWSDEADDLEHALRFNNFFYVMMHDHFYTRGYVESAIPSSTTMEMCGCIEQMNPVSRADCSEVAPKSFEFEIKYDVNIGELTVVPTKAEFKFQACTGVNPATGVAKDNDLASKAHKLLLEGKMSAEVKDEIFSVVVGHNNVDDNTNEAACEAAWNLVSNEPYNGRRQLKDISDGYLRKQ